MTKKQSFYKTLTWRFIASTTTFFLGWAVTGDVEQGAGIAGMAAVIKMVLYYAHERAWAQGLT